MEKNARRAVGRECIVEGRPMVQFVDRFLIIEKNPSEILRGTADAVNINVLLGLAIRGADADHVSLIRNHVIELVLSKKTGERGITFIFFFARLYRDGQVIFAGETEAHHNMRDRLARPINRDDVGGVELVKIIGPSFPSRGEIGFRSIIEVSQIVDCNEITVDR